MNTLEPGLFSSFVLFCIFSFSIFSCIRFIHPMLVLLFLSFSFGLRKMDVHGFSTALRYEKRLVLLLVES